MRGFRMFSILALGCLIMTALASSAFTPVSSPEFRVVKTYSAAMQDHPVTVSVFPTAPLAYNITKVHFTDVVMADRGLFNTYTDQAHSDALVAAFNRMDYHKAPPRYLYSTPKLYGLYGRSKSPVIQAVFLSNDDVPIARQIRHRHRVLKSLERSI